jgi:predicted metal-binding membrane protein
MRAVNSHLVDIADTETRQRPCAQPLVVAALVAAVCRAISVYSARTMSATMTMPGGWEMSMAWMRMPGQYRLGAAAMFLTMWQLLMVAMMRPSTMPVAVLYRRFATRRRRPRQEVATT